METSLLAGRTRIHLDRVEGLGHFVELEVVLDEDEPAEVGVALAHELLDTLGISSRQLIGGAYVDLLAGIPDSAPPLSPGFSLG